MTHQTFTDATALPVRYAIIFQQRSRQLQPKESEWVGGVCREEPVESEESGS